MCWHQSGYIVVERNEEKYNLLFKTQTNSHSQNYHFTTQNSFQIRLNSQDHFKEIITIIQPS